MYKINISNVHLVKKIYVPMLAPLLTLEETKKYEDIKNQIPGTRQEYFSPVS